MKVYSSPNNIIKFENIPIDNVRFFRDNIVKYERQHGADFMWRKTTNRWHSLAAEIMLQRTRAEQVLVVYTKFILKYHTPSDYIADEKAKTFTSLGLTWREKTFRELADVLSTSNIPSDSKSLLALPGIGEYIASAFRSLHLGIRDYIIDSNVVRIYGRYFGFQTDGETRRKKWFVYLADRLTPLRNYKDYNYGLIDFTRDICKLKPDCSGCVLNRKCSHFSSML